MEILMLTLDLALISAILALIAALGKGISVITKLTRRFDNMEKNIKSDHEALCVMMAALVAIFDSFLNENTDGAAIADARRNLMSHLTSSRQGG